MVVIKVHCLCCGRVLNPRRIEKRLSKIKKIHPTDVKAHHRILLEAYTCNNTCFLEASKAYEEKMHNKRKEAEERDEKERSADS